MEYYWVTKRNELLIWAATWVNRKHIMLSERSQTQTIACCKLPFT